MIFTLGVICGFGAGCIAGSIFLFLKVIPDFQEYEREIEALKARR